VQRTNIYLEEEQLRAVKHLAADDRESVAVLVREAIDTYLAQRVGDGTKWNERFASLLEHVQGRVPADIPTDEIEADIRAARDGAQRAHRAARRRQFSER